MKNSKAAPADDKMTVRCMTLIESAELFNLMFWQTPGTPQLFGPFASEMKGQIVWYSWTWKVRHSGKVFESAFMVDASTISDDWHKDPEFKYQRDKSFEELMEAMKA